MKSILKKMREQGRDFIAAGHSHLREIQPLDEEFFPGYHGLSAPADVYYDTTSIDENEQLFGLDSGVGLGFILQINRKGFVEHGSSLHYIKIAKNKALFDEMADLGRIAREDDSDENLEKHFTLVAELSDRLDDDGKLLLNSAIVDWVDTKKARSVSYHPVEMDPEDVQMAIDALPDDLARNVQAVELIDKDNMRRIARLVGGGKILAIDDKYIDDFGIAREALAFINGGGLVKHMSNLERDGIEEYIMDKYDYSDGGIIPLIRCD